MFALFWLWSLDFLNLDFVWLLKLSGEQPDEQRGDLMVLVSYTLF